MSAKISTAAIVFNGGKLFIARRLPGGDMGGKWEFPGGKAEELESPQTALVRELREEFGVDAEAREQLAESSFVHNNIEHKLLAFRAAFLSFDFVLTEHSEWKWASSAEIKELYDAGVFTPSDYKLLDAVAAAGA